VAGGLIAGGYQGPPALSVARVLTSWTADLPMLAVALLAAGLYLAGVRRVRRAGEPWPAWRSVSFLVGGVGMLLVATVSFLGVYQGVLFSIRAAQTVVLLLVVPLFAAMGRPLSLAAGALPQLRPRIERVLGSRAARILTFPAISALVLVIVPFLFYFTPWYRAGLDSGLARELTYVALTMPGLVFFWTLLRVDPVPKAYPYLVSLWVTGAEVVGDAILGIAVIADQHLIAGAYYHALARPWGPGPRADQVVGGGALWILGDIVGLPFLVAQLIQMIREDEQEAVRVDAELDAAEAVAAAPGVAAQGVAAQAAGVQAAGVQALDDGTALPHDRPWWESDPRFSGRFRRPGGL
jgi:cytochrome c oxidase assembly factor CtaG